MHIKTLKRLHELISHHSTGTLTDLAKKFDVAKSTMSDYLRQLREEYAAPIAYDRDRGCYYYTEYFDLIIEIRIIRVPPEKK